MKIANISKSDRFGGGASRVAEDLTTWLQEKNIHIDHFSRSSRHNTTIPLYNDFSKKIYHRLKSLGFQEIIPFEKKFLKKYDKINSYDIFHFHDLSTAISPLTLKWLSDNKKNVVWTLHDCSAVTGGCIYTLECTQYKSTCRKCPQLGNLPLAKNFDFTFLFHKLKKYVHKNTNMTYVSPSKWLADFVYDTGYLKTYPMIIPNGIDTSIFQYLEKKKAREKLHLPQDRFIIILSASSIFNPYKGVQYAIKTLRLIKSINPYVILMGNIKKEELPYFNGLDIKSTGYIEDKMLQNQYFASADIFLNTTEYDNLPLVVLESMASGTPNVGFATGGIPEMVDSGINGFLINEKSSKLLAKKILKIYNHKIYKDWSHKSRKKVIDKFSKDIFIENHINLYRETIQ